MLFFVFYLLLSYILNLQSGVYYSDKEHLLFLDNNLTLQSNPYYTDSKNLIYYGIVIYYLNLIFGPDIYVINNILICSFFLQCFKNLLKITHGIYYNKTKYFLLMLLEFSLLYLKIFYSKNNIFNADNIIFMNFYFIYLLIDA
jgi:hypothetical protein